MEDGELLEATGGDRARARILGQLLSHISRSSPDEKLREMAGGVLNGETSLADAVSSSAYSEAIGVKASGFVGWYAAMSETERVQQAEVGAEEIAKVRETLDGEDTARHRSSSP